MNSLIPSGLKSTLYDIFFNGSETLVPLQYHSSVALKPVRASESSGVLAKPLPVFLI